MSSPSTISVVGFLDVDGFECQLYQRENGGTRNTPCIVVNSSRRVVSVSPEAKKLGVNRKDCPTERSALKMYPHLTVFRNHNEFGKPSSRKTRHGTWELLDAVKEFCSRSTDIIIELASSDEIYLEISGEVTRGIEQRRKLERYSYPPFQLDEIDNQGVGVIRSNVWYKRRSDHYLPPVNLDHSIVWEQYRTTIKGPCLYKLQTEFDRRSASLRQAARDEERLIFGALFIRALVEHVRLKTGLSASGGVAKNRLLAKVGCGLNKPAKITILPETSWNRVAKTVKISDIPGLGGKHGADLMDKSNIKTIADLRSRSLEQLESLNIGIPASVLFSWARGQDNEPVIDKQMKKSLRCNKPGSPIISNLSGLKMAVNNLSAEVGCLLNEERQRHKRIVRFIKVEFSITTNNTATAQESEQFDISNYGPDLHTLAERVLEHLVEKYLRGKNEFVVDTLGFVMKDFYPDSMDILQEKFNFMSLEIPRVDELLVHPKSKPYLPAPRFNSKLLSLFGTTGGEEYWGQNVTLRKVINSTGFNNLIGRFLADGYPYATTVTDHLSNYELKHKHFLQWMLEFQLLEKIADGTLEKPDFIAFNGRLADCMQTPDVQQFLDWELHASNVAGIVFLWDEKKPQDEISFINYNGLGFESLLCKTSNPNTICNEFQHVYSVTSTTFGQHNLLVVNEIDGEDEDGNFLEIRLMNERAVGHGRIRNYRKLWASNTIAGVHKFIIGIHSQGILKDVSEATIEEVELILESRVDACLNFEHRFLDWVKSHLRMSNRQIVRKYSWVCGSRKVTSEQVAQEQIPHLILPRFYGNYLDRLEM